MAQPWGARGSSGVQPYTQLDWCREQRMVVGMRSSFKIPVLPHFGCQLSFSPASGKWPSVLGQVLMWPLREWDLGACDYFSPVYLGSCLRQSEGLKVFPVPFEAGLKQERMCWLGREASSCGEIFPLGYLKIKSRPLGTSLVVQWLRLRAPSAGGPRFDPWLGN